MFCIGMTITHPSETESTWYCGQYWPLVPAPDDRWWWLWSNWWNEDRQGKPKYSEKTYPSATCEPQIPHDLIRARTRVAAVGIRWLIAWAMARPSFALRRKVNIFTRDSVTIDGVRVGNLIYWTLLNNSWLHFTNHYCTQTSVLSHGLHCAAW
jgi:hypothetical protein